MKKHYIVLFVIIFFYFVSCSKNINSTEFSFSNAPEVPNISKSDSDLIIDNLPNRDSSLFLNLEYIKKLPNKEINAYYPYLESRRDFRGFPLYDFLKFLGINPQSSIKLYAKDGYSVVLTPEIMKEFKHWLTYEQDGKLYSDFPSDDQRGPYALVLSANLTDEEVLAVQYQLIWLIERIEIINE